MIVLQVYPEAVDRASAAAEKARQFVASAQDNADRAGALVRGLRHGNYYVNLAITEACVASDAAQWAAIEAGKQADIAGWCAGDAPMETTRAEVIAAAVQAEEAAEVAAGWAKVAREKWETTMAAAERAVKAEKSL